MFTWKLFPKWPKTVFCNGFGVVITSGGRVAAGNLASHHQCFHTAPPDLCQAAHQFKKKKKFKLGLELSSSRFATGKMSSRSGVGQIRGATLGPQPLKATVPYQLAIKPRSSRRDGKSGMSLWLYIKHPALSPTPVRLHNYVIVITCSAMIDKVNTV